MSSSQRLSLLAIPFLGVLTGTAALSLDMYLPAFPAMAEDLGVEASEVQKTMGAFLGGFAVGQLFYGPLSDRLGRRAVVLIGLFLYGVISALCALSTDVESLILYRIFQGVAGASGSVLGRAIIRDVYEGPALTKAMSMLMMVLTAAPMAAPLIGSFVLQWADWRAIFWTLTAYAFLWSFLMILLIPETLDKEKRISFTISTLISSFAQVLRHRLAMGYTLSAGLGFAGMFIYIAETPFLYMDVFGITPSQYSLFFASNVVGMTISSAINRRYSDRISLPQLMSFISIVLLASSAALVLNAVMGWGGVWGMAIPLFFYVGSLSAMAANGISGAMQNFGHIAGTASSVFGGFQFGLGSLGGFVMAYFHDGNASTMAFLIMGCAILSFSVFKFCLKNGD